MDTGRIQLSSELEALNKATKPARKHQGANFADDLAHAATTRPANQLLPLYSSDFLGGNSSLSSKPNPLKPLTVDDFGHLVPASHLHPLDEDEPVARVKEPPTDRHAQLVKQSEKLVAQTFYGTMLKQMRESPFKSNLFDGGRAGQSYQSLLDQNLADHMAKGAGGRLVKSLVRSIERKFPDGANLTSALSARPDRNALNNARIP